MGTTHLRTGRAKGRARYAWGVVAAALVVTGLPITGAVAQQAPQAPELAGVVVGDNLPVAPTASTPATAVGRVAGGIGVDPADPDHIVTFTWDMYADPGKACEHHVSRDGGKTWTSGTFPTPAGYNTEGVGNRGFCSNERGGGRHASHGEMEFGADGVIYVAFVGVKEGRLGYSLLLSKSTDGGDTWSVATEAVEGGTSEFFDAPTFLWGRVAVDPGAGTGGADRVYVQGEGDIVGSDGAISQGNIAVAVSNDGGATFSDPIAVNRVDQTSSDDPADFGARLGSQIAIGPDGTAYTSFRDDGRPEGMITVARSTDGGTTWTTHEAVEVRAFTTPGDPPSPQATSGYPHIAVDRNNGTLYLVYQQDEPLPAAAASTDVARVQDHWFDPDARIFLIKSTDNAQTWSDPVRVSDATPAKDGNIYHETRIPNVGVSPSGRVDVVWMDRRHWTEGHVSDEAGSQMPPGLAPDPNGVCVHSHAACTDARLGDIYYSFSTNEGQTFSADERITDYSSNNDLGLEWDIGPFWFHGMDLDYAGDDMVAAWSDSRRAKAEPTVGFSPTSSDVQCPPSCRFSSGVEGPETNDLFIAHVSHGNPADAMPPVRAVPGGDPATLSAALSELGYPGGREARLTGNRITSPFSRAVVVNETDWQSALVGSVLARRYMGPVLATPADTLPLSVSDDIDRMDLAQYTQADLDNPDVDNADQLVHRALGGAIILGETGQISASIQSNIEGRDVEVERIGGDHVAMAAAVARQLDDRFDDDISAGTPAFDAVVIVNPDDPTAAVASVLAANRRLPVLFVDTDTIPAATQSALDDLDIDTTLIVGDTSAVSQSVAGQLPGAQRLSGSDVYDLSKAVVAESDARGLPENVVYVVDDDPMSAALAGSAVARAGGLLVAAPNASASAGMDTITELGLQNFVQRVVPLAATAAGKSCETGNVPAADFSDRDTFGSVHLADIDCAAFRGIVGGFKDGTFKPEQQVPRDQAASFIARTLDASGASLPAPRSDKFTDVSSSSPHFDAIHRLAAAGIIQGGPGKLPDTSYGPSRLVRRDEMAALLLRAAEFATGKDLKVQTATFKDVPSSSIFFASVNGAAKLGLTNGFTADTFGPDKKLRRNQTASFATRLLRYLEGAS